MNQTDIPQLNKQLQRFQPSAINAIFSLTSRLKAEGRDILDLSIGEPDLNTPEHIKQAAIDAIRADNTRYTPSDGTKALKLAVINKLKRDNGLSYTPGQIAIDSGVKPLLFHVMQAVLDQGSEVIVPTPCWTSYPGMVMLAGAEPVFVSCPQEKGFKLQAEDLEAAINKNTRLVLLNSPSNPTGSAYDAEELKALTEVLLRHPHVWVLTDEIYEHIVFGDFKHVSLVAVEPALYDRTVVLNGVSKAYCMTGWRIGYAAGPESLMQALLKVLSQGAGCPCSISQAAAVAALEGPQEYLKDQAHIYQKRRDFLIKRLNAMPGLDCNVPEGAFYLFPSCAGVIGKHTPQGNTLNNSADFVSYLLEHASVALVPGSAFNYDPNFRLSYAASLTTLENACDRVEAAILELS